MNERLNFPSSATASPFRTPQAVDVWDAQFRWREDGRLRDVTIDATWQRVAHVLAAGSLPRERELLQAMAGWALLPDPRLIATAGTPQRCEISEPTASLNLGAFVSTPHAPGASIDLAGLAHAASLAVRALDSLRPQPSHLRIGVIGFGDALELLHIDYASPDACALARDIARTIWCSAVETSADLAQSGGATIARDEEWLAHASALGLAEATIERIRHSGMRHARLTAITSQPALARLANCASDALDPSGLPCGARKGRHEVICHRPLKSTVVPADALAQLRIREAMQPWLDEPIESPLVVADPCRAAVRA